jgi:hypothetical protein
MLARSKTPTGRLEQATADHASATAKLNELETARATALLADDDTKAARLDGEIEQQRRLMRGFGDKINLLQEAAAEEERQRKVKERQGLIDRIEVKLQLRDRAGAELAEAVAKADAAFRKMIDIGLEIQAAWNWQAHDLPACLLSHAAITHALTAELYRVGGRPMMGGGQVEKPHAGIHFPGAKCPRFELVHMQDKITPFADVLKQATAHASNILRGKPIAAPIDVSVPVTTNGQGEAPQRTDAEARLASLLKRQAELAEDLSPAGEVAYRAQMEFVRQAQDEVTAEQQLGARHAGSL